MWIKRTRVKTRTSDIRYLQLMQTMYRDGKSRQKVILNLGREENVDRETAEALANAISNDNTYDFIDEQQMALLPSRLYGEIHILMKLFEITSMQRFCLDAAVSRGTGEATVQSVFMLLCYYSLNFSGNTSLSEWASQYYITDTRGLQPENLREAFGLLAGIERIHPGIATLYRNANHSGELLFSLCCETDYLLPGASSSGYSIFTVNREQFPLAYKYVSRENLKLDDREASRRVWVSDSPRVIQNIQPSRDHFILRIPRNMLGKFFSNPNAVLEACGESATYLPIMEYGYRSLRLEHLRCIFLTDVAGELGEVGIGARDIIISNCEGSDEELLQQFLMYQEIADLFAELPFPEEIADLAETLNPATLEVALIHLQGIIVFLIAYLELKLKHKQSFEQVLSSLRNIRVARLQLDHSAKLIHTRHSAQQENLLNTIAFH